MKAHPQMKVLALALVALLFLVATACGRNQVPEIKSGLAPEDAHERANLPSKCKTSRTFDDDCRNIFDKTWGPGAGDNESANLKIKHAYSGRHTPSTAKPAPRLGNQ